MAQVNATEAYCLIGFSAAQDQKNVNIVPDSMRDDESSIDATTEDVEASGGSGDVLQREIWSGCGFMSYYDESAHGIRKE